ncbi:MAG: tetratricopeptide repeat protein, partial [Pseudomonadota bacterium]
MSDQQDTFLREVEEEYRRDRVAKFFDKYGVALGAAIVAGLAGLGGYYWYSAYQTDLQQKAGRDLVVAERLLNSEKDEERTEALSSLTALANNGPVGYRTLAGLRLGGELETAGKKDEALAAYKKVAETDGADPKLQSLARLRIAVLEATPETWAQTKSRITPIATDESPWKYSAREQLALAAIAAKQENEARTTLLQLIADEQTPPAMKRRAEMLMSVLTSPKPVPGSKEPEKSAPENKPSGTNDAPKPGDQGNAAESGTTSTASEGGNAPSPEATSATPAAGADTKKPEASATPAPAGGDEASKTEASSASGGEAPAKQPEA